MRAVPIPDRPQHDPLGDDMRAYGERRETQYQTWHASGVFYRMQAWEKEVGPERMRYESDRRGHDWELLEGTEEEVGKGSYYTLDPSILEAGWPPSSTSLSRARNRRVTYNAGLYGVASASGVPLVGAVERERESIEEREVMKETWRERNEERLKRESEDRREWEREEREVIEDSSLRRRAMIVTEGRMRRAWSEVEIEREEREKRADIAREEREVLEDANERRKKRGEARAKGVSVCAGGEREERGEV